MLERLTAEARRAIVLAREEAARLHSDQAGSEHILLGLLGERGGIACRVLAGFGLSLEGGREQVAAIGSGGQEPDGRIRFSLRAKKVLELAARESLALRNDYIGTEHILLGVIREGDGAGAEIVDQHADLAAVRRAVLGLMPVGTEDIRAFRWLRVRAGMNPGDRGAVMQGLRVTPAADAVMTEAGRLAGSKPAGTNHLLLAALADADTAAARALTALGVDLDLAMEALRGADVTGTGDEQPEAAGRLLAIRLSEELAEIEAAD